MVIACSGYRVTAKIGHHQASLEAAKLELSGEARKLLDYFDACRRKRNRIDYVHAHVATETEAEEIVTKTVQFCQLVEQWIATNHPALR